MDVSANKRDLRTGDKKTTDASIGAQIWVAVQIIGEIFALFAKILFAIAESTFRKIVPVEPKSVRGEIVLITGAGHGIGKELALQYAALGATVVAWDINQENNESTVKEIRKLGYPKAYAYVCDVSNREMVLKLSKEVQTTVGDVTILVNNAGIMPARKLEDHTPEIIEKIFRVNVLAHFWTLEAFLPTMRKHNNGHIVALSSGAGLVGVPNIVPYCGSKFAVRGYMEALHEELRLTNPNSNIKFTTIMPSITDTGLCKKPVIRFPKLMPIIPPEKTAAEIIKAQRTEMLEVTIPGYILGLNNNTRLLPLKAAMHIKDFLEYGVDSDL